MADAPIAYESDNFDLPRWQDNSSYTMYHTHDAQAQQQQLHHAQVSQANVLPGVYSASSRPPPTTRVSHLIEQEQPPALTPSSSLARAGSITAAAGATLRSHRHQPDDLEKAFSSDASLDHRHTLQQQQPQQQQVANPFYPSSVAYSQHSPAPNAVPNNTSAGAQLATSTSDPYGDYYGPPRRGFTEGAASGTRSPRRANTQIQTSVSATDMYGVPTSAAAPMFPSTSFPGSNTYGSASLSSQATGAADQSSAYLPSHSQSVQQSKPPSSPLSASATRQAANPVNQYPRSSYDIHAYSTESPNTLASSASTQQTLANPSSASHTPIPSISSPSSPYAPGSGGGHHHVSSQSHPTYLYPGVEPMAVEPTQLDLKRRSPGLRRVRDSRDLRPYVNSQPNGRRVDPLGSGTFLSPLRALTTHIATTYNICNPSFRYETAHNPRRVLTKPSKPAHNDGYDNEDYDYILYVNDFLGSEEGHRYLILDVLGQGTFGQVVKCQNMKTHEVVAVKVVKNKPAYFNQSMMEVTILELLNKQCDPHDEHHILRLRDSFIHRNHLCLVFELLSSNLYELIKQNSFQGLSTQLVKVFTAQLLDALTVLKEARLIHCDLKPENILLKSLQSPQIKVIDFGSACHERQTVYTYIQSRFYRSPEVLMGCSYNSAIDMWSLGCIAVELFLGLPLFPGTSEYNQVSRIVEMLGLPPTHMIERGKQAGQFFEMSGVDEIGKNVYRLKSIEQYSREHNTQEQPGKKYFQFSALPDIIKNAPLPPARQSGRQSTEMDKEMNNRMAFIDFCQGLLHLDPHKRWTPQQARQHPFITGEKFTRPFAVADATLPMQATMTVTPAQPQKHAYGGLVAQPQKQGTRAYQDAATYNQHLAQHQAYTAAQAQAAQASNAFRNPYVGPQEYAAQQQAQQQAQQAPPQVQVAQQAVVPQQPPAVYVQPASQPVQQQPQQQMPHRSLTHHSSNGALRTSQSLYPAQATGGVPQTIGQSGAPPSHLDAIPPALARLSQMGALETGAGGRNALTPVMNRDDAALREWERRQAAKQQHASAYPPALEYLQQQAEMAANSGLTNWPTGHHGRYQAHQPSSLHQSHQPSNLQFQAPPPALVDNQDRMGAGLREVVMTNVRNAARGNDQSSTALAASTAAAAAAALPNPPQAYSGASARYAGSSYPQQQQAGTGYDAFDGRSNEMNALYVPMQPHQYQAYPSPTSPTQSLPQQARHVPPPSATNPSFYSAAVIPSGQPGVAQQQQQQRNPYPTQSSPNPQVQQNPKRVSGMDWPR